MANYFDDELDGFEPVCELCGGSFMVNVVPFSITPSEDVSIRDVAYICTHCLFFHPTDYTLYKEVIRARVKAIEEEIQEIDEELKELEEGDVT